MSCKYCSNWNTTALSQQKKKKNKQKKVKYGVQIRQCFKVWRLLFMPHINCVSMLRLQKPRVCAAQSIFFEPSFTKHLKNVQDNPCVVKRPKSFVYIYIFIATKGQISLFVQNCSSFAKMIWFYFGAQSFAHVFDFNIICHAQFYLVLVLA